MEKYYAVLGRIHGDDEDSLGVYQAKTKEEAIALFKAEVLNEGCEGDCEEDCEENDAVGLPVYITNVLESAAEITPVVIAGIP